MINLKIHYHSTLASYFTSKPLYLDEPTQKKPNTRKLVEQPWQQTKGEMWDEVSDTLSDLLFIEAKCRSGRIYDLLNDFDDINLSLKIPELKYVRQTVSSSLEGLFLAPNYHLSILWNYFRWLISDKNVPVSFHSNLTKAQQKLMGSSIWLRALAPLQDIKQTKPYQFPIDKKYIQALNMKTRSLAETDGSSTICIVDIRSGKLIVRKQLNGGGIIGISLSDIGVKVVAIDKSGSLFYENTCTGLKVRAGESLLKWVNGDVIFVREDESLIAWNQEKNEIKVLFENLPKPLIALNVDNEVPCLLFIAGYRKQILGIANFESNEWSVKLLDESYGSVVAGDIDFKNGFIVLGTAESILFLIDIKDETILKKSSYQTETGSRLRGLLNRVSFGIGSTEGTIFLATDTGQVWNWNYKIDKYIPYGDFKKYKEEGSCLSMDVWDDTGLPFVSTEYKAMTLVSVEFDSVINQPVSGICITDSLQIVTLSYYGNSICFYKPEGLISIKNSFFPSPLSLCQSNETDLVWVGDKRGFFYKTGTETTDIQNEVMFVGNAIIGIFESNQPGMLWVAMTDGDIMCVPEIASDGFSDKKKTKILWNGNGYEKRIKVLPASNYGTFWCLTAIENQHNQTISLVLAKQQAFILAEDMNCTDIAVSSDFTLFATIGSSIKIYHYKDTKWELLHSCVSSSTLIAFVEDKKYLVAAQENWLHVHEISQGLPVKASINLSSKIMCLSVKYKNVAAGLQSGGVVSFLLETEFNQKTNN